MLMFAKLALMSSFLWTSRNMLLPKWNSKKNLWQIFERKGIYLPYLNRADSTGVKFIFVSDPKSNICKKKFRYITSEVIIAHKIYERFDSLHEYWEKFYSRKENLRKCLGYFEIEHIGNPCFVTIACNPKEYY